MLKEHFARLESSEPNSEAYFAAASVVSTVATVVGALAGLMSLRSDLSREQALQSISSKLDAFRAELRLQRTLLDQISEQLEALKVLIQRQPVEAARIELRGTIDTIYDNFSRWSASDDPVVINAVEQIRLDLQRVIRSLMNSGYAHMLDVAEGFAYELALSLLLRIDLVLLERAFDRYEAYFNSTLDHSFQGSVSYSLSILRAEVNGSFLRSSSC